MATYSFTVRKGKYKLELVTTDKELLTEQFALWVNSADEYMRTKKSRECKNLVETEIRKEEEITKKNIESQIAKHEPAKEPEQFVEEKPEPQKPAKEPEKNADLDIFYAPPVSEVNNDSENQDENDVKQTGVFDDILENSIKNPRTELSFKPNPMIKKDNAYINFMSERNIERKVDYLLYTAYYFSQFEQKARFTLKQLNSKLMQNLAVIVDHSVLQEAINRDYIECLPDLTGLVGASEYRLTAYGEKNILEA